MRGKRKLSPEQIQRQNLNRTLNRLKVSVAEREQLWTEFFFEVLPTLLGETEERTLMQAELGDLRRRVELASLIADECLDRYEDRWGKVGKE